MATAGPNHLHTALKAVRGVRLGDDRRDLIQGEQLDLPERRVRVRVDRDRTRTIVANLLSNRASTGLAQALARYVALAHAHGLQFRVDELNSAALAHCLGRPGVSSTFAIACFAATGRCCSTSGARSPSSCPTERCRSARSRRKTRS